MTEFRRSRSPTIFVPFPYRRYGLDGWMTAVRQLAGIGGQHRTVERSGGFPDSGQSGLSALQLGKAWCRAVLSGDHTTPERGHEITYLDFLCDQTGNSVLHRGDDDNGGLGFRDGRGSPA